MTLDAVSGFLPDVSPGDAPLAGFRAGEPRAIVVVEDSDEDYGTLLRLLRRLAVPNPVLRFSDADDCYEFLTGGGVKGSREPYPALILLDINLPGTCGSDLLSLLKTHPVLKKIPVTMVTSSDDAGDVNNCYELGANGYIVKEGDVSVYQTVLDTVVRYWLKTVKLPSL